MSNLNESSNMYTTGELAKLCGVSVRTVQYYDERNILVPSELSEGGRRLYTDDDLKRLRIICFLREAGLSINSIAELFKDEICNDTISLLLEEHERVLTEEISERRQKLELAEGIRRELKNIEKFSVDSINDIAYILRNKRELKKVRIMILVPGIIIDILQWVSIILWIAKGFWQLFAAWAVIAVVFGIWVSSYYFKNIDYICPNCHTVFKPPLKEIFFAKHTPTLRKLTCSSCGHHGFCVELYRKNKI